jgi:hypothetical protein
MRKVLFSLSMVCLLIAAAPSPHAAVQDGAMKWGDAPPVFAKGAKMAVLAGDPSKNDVFVVRLKMPDGYKIMPHWHPTREHVTVISGKFNIGMGEKFDSAKADAISAGGFAYMDAKMAHYAWSQGETVVQVEAMGPFALTYVNPADDPSKMATK